MRNRHPRSRFIFTPSAQATVPRRRRRSTQQNRSQPRCQICPVRSTDTSWSHNLSYNDWKMTSEQFIKSAIDAQMKSMITWLIKSDLVIQAFRGQPRSEEFSSGCWSWSCSLSKRGAEVLLGVYGRVSTKRQDHQFNQRQTQCVPVWHPGSKAGLVIKLQLTVPWQDVKKQSVHRQQLSQHHQNTNIEIFQHRPPSFILYLPENKLFFLCSAEPEQLISL